MSDGKGGYKGPSLRNPVSGTASPLSIGESVRDLERAVRSFPDIKKVSRINQAYVPPFYLSFPHLPFAVVLGRAKNAKDVVYTSATFIGWQWDKQSIRIDEITGLVVGTYYDLNFLIFG